MKKKIEKYTPKFKKEAVKLALQAEYSKAVIANEVGINRNTLYIWIQKAMQEREDIYQKLKARILLLKDRAGARYIKKSRSIFCKPRSVRYAFIKKHGACYPIRLLYEILGICKSGSYNSLNLPVGKRRKATK